MLRKRKNKVEKLIKFNYIGEICKYKNKIKIEKKKKQKDNKRR